MYLEAFALVVLIYLVFEKRRISRLPPGPFQLPIIGNLVDIYRANPRFPYLAIDELSKKYGPIMSLKLGALNYVVLSTIDDMEALLPKDECSARADIVPAKERRFFNPDAGILFNSEESWRNVRRFTTRTLREFGFEKSQSMEYIIQQELDELNLLISNQLETQSHVIIYMDNFFGPSMANIIWSYLFGCRKSLDDKNILRLLEINKTILEAINFDKLIVGFPWLKHIIPGLSGYNFQVKIFQEQQAFLKEQILIHKTQLSNQPEPTNFVQAYLLEIEKQMGSKLASYFTEEHLIVLLMDLIDAGFSTTSSLLSYMIITMVLHPRVQDRLYAEISEVSSDGTSLLPCDIEKMPYTQAVQLEILRFANPLPYPPPRVALKDVTHKGYLIPKGTAIVQNFQAVFYDTYYWKDPEVFRPERFLDSTQQHVVGGERVATVFGFGKRSCIGEALARHIYSMFLTTLIQKFSFEPVSQNELPSMVPKGGIVKDTQPFSVRIRVR